MNKRKEMNVKACPPDCEFDWVDFHEKFDKALAHMMRELKENYRPFIPTPSQITTLDVMEFSAKKLAAGFNERKKEKVKLKRND